MEKEFTPQPASLDSEDFEEYPFLAPILWDKIKYDDLVEVDISRRRESGKEWFERHKIKHLHKEDAENANY